MIYFVRSGDAIKIGYAEKPDRRIAALCTASAEEIIALGVMDGSQGDERALHSQFAKYHLRGEWFRACDDILQFIAINCRPLKSTVFNHGRLRLGDRSETVISFRGSRHLKQQLAMQRAASRASGKSFNEWMERVITDALEKA